MNKALLFIAIPVFTVFAFFFLLAPKTFAQQSTLHFSFSGGGGDGLGPGEFMFPLKCNLNYWSWTYAGHSKYSVDINRGNGEDDRGDPVFASADGTVEDVYPPNGQVLIAHEGGYYTLYDHMQNISARKGQRVGLGDKIGEIDNVGNSQGSHLHVNHIKGDPRYESSHIQVCYKGYGCNPASVPINTRTRYGTDYNKGCR